MKFNLTMGDGNKVAQLNTKNINSNYSSSMEVAFAKHGYISSVSSPSLNRNIEPISVSASATTSDDI